MNKQNRLAKETSPYLQQHANNPVDWYPWGEEALVKAKLENKPILLSIGYSTCHWCHVMAHESFEDFATAEIMNQLFINIKVDREERPDLDKIYQMAHQILSGHAGGWPLTVFLNPNSLFPFYTGTYFPKEPRHQLPAFTALLQQIADFYKNNQTEIENQSKEVIKRIQYFNNLPTDTAVTLNIAPWHFAIQQLTANFDRQSGGFGQAPKFPHPGNLELLMQDWFINKKLTSSDNLSFMMVELSLIKMCLGGIYDQIGGGFFRYSVDAFWEIPHFEKMLYDNAQLLIQLNSAYLIKPQPLFKKAILETANWVMRDMQSPEGGYYSAIDADSEGAEGRYYTWTPEQIQSLLTPVEYENILIHFNLQQKANFEEGWHLHITQLAKQISEKTKESIEDVSALLHSAQLKLLYAREKRVAPAYDKKILTAWNALMIKGMLAAGIQQQELTWLTSAEQALDFIMENLWKNNRLLACYTQGRAHLSAYLDDYAFLLDAVLLFLEYRWDSRYLQWAIHLADNLLAHFADHENGGFYFVANDHEKLVYRPKTLTDEAIPAGNSIACYALQRLGYLLGNEYYLSFVEKTLQATWPSFTKYPEGYSSLLLTLNEFLTPPKIIILRGEQDIIQDWKMLAIRAYHADRLIFAIPADEIDLPPAIAAKKSDPANPVAYICQGNTCLAPITDLAEFKKFLQ